MHISDLSKTTGVSLRSLRYYEEKQLLSPSRTENGYRNYSELDIERVRKIQLYLKLGVSTDELAHLFQQCEGFPEHSNDRQAECAVAFYEQRLENIRQQLDLLREAELELEKMAKHWKQRQVNAK